MSDHCPVQVGAVCEEFELRGLQQLRAATTAFAKEEVEASEEEQELQTEQKSTRTSDQKVFKGSTKEKERSKSLGQILWKFYPEGLSLLLLFRQLFRYDHHDVFDPFCSG